MTQSTVEERFKEKFPIVKLHDPNIPFFAKDLSSEILDFIKSDSNSQNRKQGKKVYK